MSSGHHSRYSAHFSQLCLASLPDQEAWGLFALANGLAYLWLQQVRSTKNHVTERVLPVMSNSGQAAGQSSQALVFTSSLSRRVPWEHQHQAKDRFREGKQLGNFRNFSSKQLLTRDNLDL